MYFVPLKKNIFFGRIQKQKTIKYFVLLKKRNFCIILKQKIIIYFVPLKKNIFFGRIQKQKTFK